MTRRHLAVLLISASFYGCVELLGPRAYPFSLNVIPVFEPEAAIVGNADSLRILAGRDSSGTFKTLKDTTLVIDPVTGEVGATITVVVLEDPSEVIVTLQAIRSSDGAVLYGGTDTIVVSSSNQESTLDSIQISYLGPAASLVTIAPRDTLVGTGAVFNMRATVLDLAGLPIVDPVITFNLYNQSDTAFISLGRLTGSVEVLTNNVGEVPVFVRTGDGKTDSTNIVLVGDAPSGIQVTPGYANLLVGATANLTATLFDGNGNPTTGTPTWTSRSTGVATVDANGVVTGVAAGTAVIVAQAAPVADSVTVTVGIPGQVIATTSVGGRTFGSGTVGVDVVVDVAVDMALAGSELLGSYNATLTWDPAVLTFAAVEVGDFALPEINTADVATGSLRFAQINANGLGGSVVIVRVRFAAAATGSTVPAAAFAEMSAAQTFTNLLPKVTVTNATVRINP
ncbi:MAG: Ig-like domain-containing protein [Gemmatimonadota bacterium]|nr:Ig-like domain-containing protein [Gemmatimonadota bacterium]